MLTKSGSDGNRLEPCQPRVLRLIALVKALMDLVCTLIVSRAARELKVCSF